MEINLATFGLTSYFKFSPKFKYQKNGFNRKGWSKRGEADPV